MTISTDFQALLTEIRNDPQYQAGNVWTRAVEALVVAELDRRAEDHRSPVYRIDGGWTYNTDPTPRTYTLYFGGATDNEELSTHGERIPYYAYFSEHFKRPEYDTYSDDDKRDARLRITATIIGRDLDSSKNLTKSELKEVFKALRIDDSSDS